MKNINIIPGMILIGFGSYYFLQQNRIALFDEFYTWPSLMLIIGISFLVHGYWGKNVESIFPGVIFSGIAIHLHVVGRLELWPDHLGAFMLIISLGFLLRYQKTGTGLFHGILFLIISGLLLFYDEIANKFASEQTGVALLLNNWWILLILFGLYLLLRKGK